MINSVGAARAVAALFALALTTMAAQACVQPDASAEYRAEVVRLINAERSSRGLRPVVLSDRLDKAASRQACDLAEMRRLSHTGADGSSLRTRLRGVGYRFRAANENVASGHRSPTAAVKGWMNSPGHRANILDRKVVEIGVAVAQSDMVYWTTVMGAPR